ncbi:MAG: hypothetical protein LH467_14400 [Gemmatimonadaceae bacterium]|nr:hypothetical protein [Gemmatimonadaceae bacterium]
MTATGPRPITALKYTLDGSEFTTTGSYPTVIGLYTKTSDSTWRLYVSESLTGGSHRLVVIALDSLTGSDSLVATFHARLDTVVFRMTVLPGLGGQYARVTDLNQSGVVVGAATDVSGVVHAVTWIGGRVQPLPDAGSSAAFALNDRGAIVGTAQDPRMTRRCLRGVIWRTGAAPELIASYPATAVPDTGVACSHDFPLFYTSPDAGASTPTRINDNGDLMTLRYLVRGSVATPFAPSWDYPQQWALNNRGQAVVSIARSPAYDYNASAVGFGVLIATPRVAVGSYMGPGRLYRHVAGINEAGTVAGTEQFALKRAFLSDSTGKATDLGTVTGDLEAVALNNPGHVLLTGHLFRNGRLAVIALNQTGWSLVSVTDLNDAGQIIGSARGPDDVSRPVLLDPMP